ncbi:MAG: hypothetical protein IJV30_02430 [Oscillospiraceae bacterium]|nr:hypothetical protein [Oscillospiraceae bacterium]
MKHSMKLLTLLLTGVLILSVVPCDGVQAAAEERSVTVIDGTGAADSLQICRVGDRLYYLDAEGLVSCAPDGSDRQVISNQTGTLFTDGETLFRGTQSKITRLYPDGTEETILKVSPLVNEGAFAIMNTMDHFAARDGQIYYVLTMAQDYELWTVGTNGSDDRRICSICPPEREILGLYLFEDLEGVYVQFSNEDGTGWSLIRVE